MEVIDGLAAIVAGVYYQSKAVGGDAVGQAHVFAAQHIERLLGF